MSGIVFDVVETEKAKRTEINRSGGGFFFKLSCFMFYMEKNILIL